MPASQEGVLSSDLEEVLKTSAEAFRKSWNSRGTHDWLSTESMLFFEGLLFVSYCREYHVHSDENAYSMIYVFSENNPGGSRIYYTKFWESRPEWRDAKQFLQSLVSAEKKDGAIIISVKAEDGTLKQLTYKPT